MSYRPATRPRREMTKMTEIDEQILDRAREIERDTDRRQLEESETARDTIRRMALDIARLEAGCVNPSNSDIFPTNPR